MLAKLNYNIPGLWREMDRFFDSGTSAESDYFPPINIYDDGENLVIKAEIPGTDPEKLEINATHDSLSIKGEKKPGSTDEKISYYRRELLYGTFERVFSLSKEVDSNKIKASYKNGVLEIILPKAQETKPRKIKVAA